MLPQTVLTIAALAVNVIATPTGASKELSGAGHNLAARGHAAAGGTTGASMRRALALSRRDFLADEALDQVQSMVDKKSGIFSDDYMNQTGRDKVSEFCKEKPASVDDALNSIIKVGSQDPLGTALTIDALNGMLDNKQGIFADEYMSDDNRSKIKSALGSITDDDQTLFWKLVKLSASSGSS